MALPVMTKQNGGIRTCIDPKPLNKALNRDHFACTPAIDDVLQKLSDAKVFSTIDVKSAFCYCKLDDESANLYAFLTPIGKITFLRLPYGVSPAPEIFQRNILEALVGLNGAVASPTTCWFTAVETVCRNNNNASLFIFAPLTPG